MKLDQPEPTFPLLFETAELEDISLLGVKLKKRNFPTGSGQGRWRYQVRDRQFETKAKCCKMSEISNTIQ